MLKSMSIWLEINLPNARKIDFWNPISEKHIVPLQIFHPYPRALRARASQTGFFSWGSGLAQGGYGGLGASPPVKRWTTFGPKNSPLDQKNTLSRTKNTNKKTQSTTTKNEKTASEQVSTPRRSALRRMGGLFLLTTIPTTTDKHNRELTCKNADGNVLVKHWRQDAAGVGRRPWLRN